MALSLQEVSKIARLARIRVDETELPIMQQHLNGILAMVEEMQSVNTDHIAPMAHAQELSLRLREDSVSEQNQREHLQACAPAVDKGLYLVPKVIE